MAEVAVSLSGIIIAKNEEARIVQAIESLHFADEVLLIDNGSSDQTVALAQKHQVRVVKKPHASFGELRNIGKDEARGRWIFYLDADEIVPKDLAKEIKQISQNILPKDKLEKETVCFFVRRDNTYLGQQWPTQDKMQRFFYKEGLLSWQGDLHETPRVKGKTAILTHPLVHNTHRTLEEMLSKTNVWSEIEASLRNEANHPPIVAWRLVRVFITGFWQSYVAQGGWRAGTVGMIESMYQGFSLFITYAKLWELQNKKK